jgi:hypothetical protein
MTSSRTDYETYDLGDFTLAVRGDAARRVVAYKTYGDAERATGQRDRLSDVVLGRTGTTSG